MKVLVIGFTKISYMPYMHFYLEQLKENNCDIHLVYWKRDNSSDSDPPQGISTYMYNRYQKDSVPLFRKLGSFLGYRRFALKILKKNNFDMIIVLHSTPGVLLFDYLLRNYKRKYVLDYRDFTYEHKSIYRKFIHRLVNNSAATFVSSDSYRKYLPSYSQIFTSHNIVLKSLEKRKLVIGNRKKLVYSDPIVIRFWGFVRHENINIEIINKLANDTRFQLHYHGRIQKTGEYLIEYCKKNNINNVFFHGEYKPDDRYEFIQYTDLVHNMYENDIKTINAMGNKYYDGVTFNVPQLCNEGSYMGLQVEKNGIGIAINPEDVNFADKVYNYYNSIDWNEFESNCQYTLNHIIKQYDDGVTKIAKIIDEKR